MTPSTALAAPATLADAVRADLARDGDVLGDPAASRAQRDEAARRLVDRGTPDARRLLAQALGNNANRSGQLAVATALADDAAPDPQFQPTLFALLAGTTDRDRDLATAAANALAAYRQPAVADRLLAFVMPDNNARVTAANLPVQTRAAVLRALGAFVDRAVADRLNAVVQNPAEPQAVRDAAADGLQRMTGLTRTGRDPARWAAWWSAAQALSPADFRDRLLGDRAAHAARLERRRPELGDELFNVTQEQYLDQNLPLATRQRLLESYLRSAVPELRAVGVRLVQDDLAKGQQLPTPATAQLLRRLIGDSDADVRLRVAQLMLNLTDRQALDPLITQLALESDPAVQVLIASTLGRLADPRAAAALLPLLDDPSERLVEAAAEGLAGVAPQLRATDPRRADEVAVALQRVLNARAARQGSEPLRARILAALVALTPRVAPQQQMTPLQDNLGRLFAAALRPSETDDVRRSGLQGLGALGEARLAGDVIELLRGDGDPGIRVEAARALGELPTVTSWPTLLERMNPGVEPNPDVRAAAWDAVRKTLDDAGPVELTNLAGRFAQDPNKRLDILSELARKYTAQRELNDLAFVQKGIADILSARGEHAAAAFRYKAALEHWRSVRNSDPVTVEQLTGLHLAALLRSGEYARAASFAAETIKSDAENQPTVAVPILRELNELKAGNKLAQAQSLIEAVENMRPGLPGRYGDEVQQLKRDVQKSLNDQGQTRPTGNASGPGPVDPAPLALAAGVSLA